MSVGGVYLHIGRDFMVKKRSVVGIFDMDNSGGADTREFLRRAQNEGLLIDTADDLPRSFAVCTTAAGEAVYLSQLSTATLQKRWNSREWLDA